MFNTLRGEGGGGRGGGRGEGGGGRKNSGTSDNGHSEEWTTSLQWTHCSPTAYILSIHFYLRGKGQPLNNGRNTRLQCVHYSEVPLDSELEGQRYHGVCVETW